MADNIPRKTDRNPLPSSQQPWSVHWKTSPTTRWAFLLRILLAAGIIPSDWKIHLSSHALQVVLVLPQFVPLQIRQSLALRTLASSSSPHSHAFADSYKAGAPHHHGTSLPPLLLALLEPIEQYLSNPFLRHFVWGILLLVVDYGIAVLLERVTRRLLDRDNHSNNWERRVQHDMPQVIQPPLQHVFPIDNDNNNNSAMIAPQNLPGLVGLLYFASPVTILAGSVGMSFQNVRILLFLLALHESTKGVAARTAIYGALAAYVDPAMIVFLLPTAILLKKPRPVAVMVLSLLLVLAGLVGLSCALVGHSKCPSIVWDTTVGTRFQWAFAPPSLAVFWYTQMQLFVRFSPYFQRLWTGLPFLLVVPVAIRLYRYPVAMVAIFWMVFSVLIRPVSTLYELNVAVCWMLLSPRSLARVNGLVCLVSLCALLVPVVLWVLLHTMWLLAGNGEANFLFFQSLAYNVFVIVLLLQFTQATSQRDKALRLTEKKKAQENRPEAAEHNQ